MKYGYTVQAESPSDFLIVLFQLEKEGGEGGREGGREGGQEDRGGREGGEGERETEREEKMALHETNHYAGEALFLKCEVIVCTSDLSRTISNV